MVGMTVTCALLDAMLAPASAAADAEPEAASAATAAAATTTAPCSAAAAAVAATPTSGEWPDATRAGQRPHPWLVTYDVPALAALRRTLHATRAARDASTAAHSLRTVVARIRASGGHPIMWRLLADEALERLDWPTARHALLALGDYAGLELLQRLTCDPQLAGRPELQAAELLAHFGRFDAAEAAFTSAGRLDLAVELRAHLGHAPRVLQLVAPAAVDAGPARVLGAPLADPLLRRAHLRAGDHCADRQAWGAAAVHYAAAGATEGLVECLGRSEDFDALAALAEALPAGSPLLPDVASRLASAGMAPEAVAGFEHAGLPDCAVAVASRLQRAHLAEAVLARRAQAAQRAVIAGARRDSERG